MSKELVNGLIATLIVAVAGIVLLYLGAQGALPTGFGLFDMSNLGVRAVVFLILVAITVVLGVLYFRGESSSS